MTGWLHPACEPAPLQSDVHPQLGCYRGHQGSPSRAVSQVSTEEIELGRGTDDHLCREGGVPLLPAERPLGACSAQPRHGGDRAAKGGLPASSSLPGLVSRPHSSSPTSHTTLPPMGLCGSLSRLGVPRAPSASSLLQSALSSPQPPPPGSLLWPPGLPRAFLQPGSHSCVTFNGQSVAHLASSGT